MNEAVFEKWLTRALDSDVQPAEDFTAQVMARVSATPQEVPVKKKKPTIKKTLISLAACAAVLLLIPVGMMLMPRGASDTAGAAEAEQFTLTADADADALERQDTNGIAADMGVSAPAEAAAEEAQQKSKHPVSLRLQGDEAQTVRAALSALDIAPTVTEDGQEQYVLTPMQLLSLYSELDKSALLGIGEVEIVLEAAE